MDQASVLRPSGRNVAQGVIEAGGTSVLLAAVVGDLLADAGSPNAVVALGAVGVLLVGGVVVWKRYAPMFVRIDKGRDVIRYRNAWTAGQLRWSGVEYFEPREVFAGCAVARAFMTDGRKVTLRAAPYERFTTTLRAFQTDSERPAHPS